MQTARAPRASALNTSFPRRTPPSICTGILPPTASTTSGRLSIVTGPSGVGKSTLLNALQPGLQLATGEVSSAEEGKGKHTTTHAELLPLEGAAGGYVADTPGIRELGLWEIPPSELAWCFPEFRDHLGGCAFNDCSHLHEPRCSVRTAVGRGDVSEERYDSYRRMLTGDLAG